MFDIPTHMDFEGQGKAEKLSRIIITLFGIAGLIYGGVVQQFSMTIYTLAGGLVLAALLTVPPWPMYRKKPLNWQKPRFEAGGDDKDKKKESNKKK